MSRWLWGPFSRTGLALALPVLVIDQLHKWWVVYIYDLPQRGKVEVLPGLDLVFTLNKGISYGLFAQDGQGGQVMLAVFAVLVSAALVVYLARGAESRLAALSLGLIIGGALGNAIDRVHFGGVADYLQPYIFDWRWPYIFNIADVAIVAGVVGLLYDSLTASRRGAAAANAAKPPQGPR